MGGHYADLHIARVPGIEGKACQTGKTAGDHHGDDDIAVHLDSRILGTEAIGSDSLQAEAQGGLIQNKLDDEHCGNGNKEGKVHIRTVEQLGQPRGPHGLTDSNACTLGLKRRPLQISRYEIVNRPVGDPVHHDRCHYFMHIELCF